MQTPQLENIICPLCNHNDYKICYRINNWSIAECKSCQFVYVNPRLTKEEILKLYLDNYFDNSDFGYLHYEESAQLRKLNFKKWVEDATPYISKKNHYEALDIGCAAGYCLEVFAERKWSAYGLELNEKYAALLANKYKIYKNPLLNETFSEVYDIITLFDVIEHLTDLKENFKKLTEILSADGTIILITPNYNSFQRKLLGKRWFQFKPAEHINYFTFQTLKKVISEVGLEIVKHKAAGQFADFDFINNRLKKYKLFFLKPFAKLFYMIRGKNNPLYTDTASLYLVLKKRQ